ncbi:MAG: hypothetical protein LRY35_03095, partial [Clostridiales bacterium]|nr:hypothetical protein [Clostridiales bacterium]
MRHEAWYRLDNVAKIYPVLARSRHLTMFRLSATLTIPVDPVILQQALDQTLERLPFFAVRLRRGLFWYYFEANPHPARIEEDVRQPLRPLLPGGARWLLALCPLHRPPDCGRFFPRADRWHRWNGFYENTGSLLLESGRSSRQTRSSSWHPGAA